MAYSRRFSLLEEAVSQKSADAPQDILQNAITLPKFVHLMSELGVTGPKQRGRLALESSFYRFLGEGAQFQAYQHTESGMVAKRITLWNMANSNAEQLQDLELEIRALANEKLYEHPNIVDLQDWGYDVVPEMPPGIQESSDLALPLLVPVLYVELASEGSLEKFLNSPRNWETRVRLCLDIAAALECLRECLILHNDIKPENILIFGDDDVMPSFRAKLADFGLSLSSAEGENLSFQKYGRTPKWKPPESTDHNPEIHGEFSNEMLFKSESYVYGMIALYTLFSLLGDSSSLTIDQDPKKRREKITSRIEAHEDTALKEDMTEAWRAIESRFLAEEPKCRYNVSPLALGFGDAVMKNG
jgi:serine/threonine protein kinase